MVHAAIQTDLSGGLMNPPMDSVKVEGHVRKIVKHHDVKENMDTDTADVSGTAPFHLGSPAKADDTGETTMVPVDLTEMADETAMRSVDVAEEVKKMEERGAVELCRQSFRAWQQHVLQRRAAPKELRSIMDTLDSGSESLVSAEEDVLPCPSLPLESEGNKNAAGPARPFALGDSSGDEQGPVAEDQRPGTSLGGGLSASSESSSESGQVERLEVQSATSGDSSA